MALAIVNEAFSNITDTSVTITGVTSGNLVIVTIGTFMLIGDTILSVTDGSNTYTHVANSQGTAHDSISPSTTDIWYSIVGTGGSLTITYNPTHGIGTANTYIIRAIEVTGFNISTPITGAATSQNTSNNTPSALIGPDVTTVQAGDWVITVFQQFVNAYVMDAPFTDFDANGVMPGGYYNPNAIGSYHGTASNGGTDEFAASAAILRIPATSNPVLQTTPFLAME